MSVRSSGSHDGPMPSSGDIIRSGVFKKMKTSRKKYFVLRAESPDALARLEYYDSEKKFRAGLPPKRSIPLKTCFNINTKTDSKHKYVIALYTKVDCFCIVFDLEEDLNVWLKDFLTLQHGEEIPEGEILRPKFEYVWHVSLCARGLGEGRTGIYRLCLTDKTITLVKVDQPIPIVIEIALNNVRSCGHLQSFFFLEVGRMSEIGAGEIWFEADDSNVALNIQATVTHRFKKARQKTAISEAAAGTTASEPPADLHPKGRNRSASATEASKGTNKKYNPIISSKHILSQGSRERCDSMPSRPRTTSETNNALASWGKAYLAPYRANLRDASHSPPTGSPISPPSDSTGSSYSLPDEHDGHEIEHQRLCSTLPPEEAIAEEEYPESPRAIHPGCDYVLMNMQDNHQSDYTYMGGPSCGHHIASNSASTSSVTSGTPSTDIKYPEYPLEKVYSYVPINDDDTRPCRAYSLGSKPPENQVVNTMEKIRTRAFSVGSKKKSFNRVLQPHHHVPGIKSNSAPLLGPNSFVGSSHGSISNPMDDLMEMDFSANSTHKQKSGNKTFNFGDRHCNHKNSSCNGTKGRFMGFLENLGAVIGVDHKKSAPDGYMDMRDKSSARTMSDSSDSAPYVDMTQRQRATNDFELSCESPYLQMCGNQVSGPNGNTLCVGNGNTSLVKKGGDYMDMTGSSPSRGTLKTMTLEEYSRHLRRHNQEYHHDYIDMNQRQRMNSNSSTYSRAATSPGALSGDHNSDMPRLAGRGSRSERTDSFGSQLSASPHFDNASHRFSDLPNFQEQSRILERSATDIDGYVPMSPGEFTTTGLTPFRHNRQSSTDSADNEHGDYLNMSKVNVALNATHNTNRSKPIAIQTTSGNTTVKNSSPLSISSLLGRKSSPTGGSPKLHLPLSPYSSLPRQRSPRKSSLQTCSSKDSSVSSSVTTTPSSSSIMFPMSLNSPSSPTVGSNAGTPTACTVKVPASVLNVPYKSSGHRKKSINEDYAMMDFESKKAPIDASRVDESPYMNYCPPSSALRGSRQGANDDPLSDYAIIRPAYFSAIKTSTLPRAKCSAPPPIVTSPLANPSISTGLNDRHSMCFMPIQETNERTSSSTPEYSDKTAESRKTELAATDDHSYDRLKSPSSLTKNLRSSSSNSETIQSQVQRPASTTGSEKPSSKTPSECSEGLTSRLGSSSSVYSSSSSTSTVVGVSTNQLEVDQPAQQVVRLHYASLDLSSDSLENRRSPKTTNETNLNEGENTTFVYADIDFVKSEELNRPGASNGPNVSSKSSSNNSASVN